MRPNRNPSSQAPRLSSFRLGHSKYQRCRCSDCKSAPDDPLEPDNGKRLPVSLALRHARDEKRRKDAEQIQERMLRQYPSPPVPPLSHASSPPSSPHSSQSEDPLLSQPSGSPTDDAPFAPLDNPQSPSPASNSSRSSRRSISSRSSRTSPSKFQSHPVLEELKTLRDGLRDPEDLMRNRALKFEQEPCLDVDTSQLTIAEIDDLCRLDLGDPTNSGVIGYQQFLSRTQRAIDRAKQAAKANRLRQQHTINAQVKVTLETVEQQKEAFRSLILREWEKQRIALQVKNYYDTARFFHNTVKLLPRAVLGLYMTVVAIHFLSDVSQADCSFILGSVRDLFLIILATSTSVFAQLLPKAIYTDMRTVVDIMDVKPEYTPYMVCPKCHALSPLDHANQTTRPTCTKSNLGSVCGASLHKEKRDRQGGEQMTPISVFHYQGLKHYLGRMFSNSSTGPWLHDNPLKRPRRPDGMWDVWDAPCFSHLRGPDGRPFISLNTGADESRLVFSMNMDGFNPGGNKEAGKKITSSAIYLICMNLPPSIRYKMENVYLVGVIPGPQAPSDHEINYILEPLIDELLEAWRDGVYLSQTTEKPQGRRVRCAVGPLVCDLPAARQMSGFAHYRSKNFCSECTQTLEDINDLNPDKWKKRSQKTHRAAATLWRDAPSLSEREKIMENYGVRWSELLRLPYWDPTLFTVIDPMHAFYLRLFQHHVRSVWGMDAKIADGKGVTFDVTTNLPSELEMQHASRILRNGTLEQLSVLQVGVLRQLTRERTTLPWRRKKAVLVEQLRQFRVRQGWWTDDGRLVENGPSEGQAVYDHGPISAPKEFESEVLPTRAAVENFWSTASKTRIGKTHRRELCILFKVKVLPALSMEEKEMDEFNVTQLKQYIHEQRHKDGLADNKGSLLASTHEKTRLLGQARLKEVRRDMKRTRQPTWVPRAPAHPGEKKWGKFTADQWKTFCTQNLPVTLIRLWGNEPEDSFERQCLDNFMHLVSAVKLANLHVIDEERIQLYEQHMLEYLTGLLRLFPGTSITPYQHLALHFGDHLRRFGPVHAWRCFPFERFNYILQNFPTNNKSGEMEQTMFSKFCCSQRIRSYYEAHLLPEPLHPLISRFMKNFSSDTRGSRLSDIFTEEELFGVREELAPWTADDLSSLPEDDFLLLRQWHKERGMVEACPRKVVLREELYRFGQRFTDFASNIDDSDVTYRPNGGRKDEWEAGSIVKIFSTVQLGGSTLRTWAVIQPYRPLSPSDAVHDHYREYPIAGGRLFLSDSDSDPLQAVLVEATEIIGHFLSSVVDVEGVVEPCFVALPLNKDRPCSLTVEVLILSA